MMRFLCCKTISSALVLILSDWLDVRISNYEFYTYYTGLLSRDYLTYIIFSIATYSIQLWNSQEFILFISLSLWSIAPGISCSSSIIFWWTSDLYWFVQFLMRRFIISIIRLLVTGRGHVTTLTVLGKFWDECIFVSSSLQVATPRIVSALSSHKF